MPKTLQTSKASSGQLGQIARIASDAVVKVLDNLGLDNLGAQRVIEHGDEFAEAIRSVASTSIKDLSVSDKFKDEEMLSHCIYFSGYKPKGLAEQTNILRQLFPELFPGVCYACEIISVLGILPPNAEGWFAIPRWEKIASTYNEAVQKVLDLIKQTRNGQFRNYREGHLGPERLFQTARSQKFWEVFGNEQKGYDILVVPAQFGFKHRGLSVRRAREVMQGGEFGLDTFAVGIMLLTHPERLMSCWDLCIDCAGDEFDDSGSGVHFEHVPIFCFNQDMVKFGTRWFGNTLASYGSASAFVLV